MTLKAQTRHMLRRSKLNSVDPERVPGINKAVVLPGVGRRRSFKPRLVAGSGRRQQMAFQADCTNSA